MAILRALVALSVSGDAAAQVTNMPQTVTINAGSATAGFYAKVADNATVDGDRVVSLSAAADGFDASEKTLTIVDDEVPQLTIEVVGVTTNSFSEGTNLVVRVWRPASVSGKALTVYLKLETASTKPSDSSMNARVRSL